MSHSPKVVEDSRAKSTLEFGRYPAYHSCFKGATVQNIRKSKMKVVVRNDHASEHFTDIRGKAPSPHPPPSRPQFCSPPSASCPSYAVLVKAWLPEPRETPCSGSRACVSRPRGWMEAKTFERPSSLVFLWKHSSGGLCWRVVPPSLYSFPLNSCCPFV